MIISRRSFLAGAASFAFGGWRIFAAPPGWKPPRKPNLVFGVLSDSHLRTDWTGNGLRWTDRYFISALKYFRDNGADAVVHCGDFADRGQVREMEFHAEAWNRVFPDGLLPDGRKIEKLFVTGNHDVAGWQYGIGFRVEKIYPDPEERAKHLLSTDMAGHWERIWGEKFEPVWHKEVKGYHFFGRNWGVDDSGADVVFENGDKPFFLLSHEFGQMPGEGAFRNAVGFFGHWHQSAVNWNEIFFQNGRPYPQIQVPSCAPFGCGGMGADAWISKATLQGKDKAGASMQGYLVKVYNDMMVVERREFSQNASLGADWVMPLFERKVENVKRKVGGEGRAHPFSKEELKKVIGEPQFRKGAKLIVECCQCENVAKSIVANNQLEIGTGNGNNSIMATLNIKIPLADGNRDSRVYAYEVAVAGDEGTQKLLKAVYARGCNMGIGYEIDGGLTTIEIPKSELPHGTKLTISARPLSSLGTSGKPIATTFKV